MTTTQPETVSFDEIVIYNDIKINTVQLDELQTSSGLERDDIIQRLQNVYTQTCKPFDKIIENFIENEYDTLNTIKSFFQSRLVKTTNGTQSTNSINQLRMRQIRNYMNERDKLKTEIKPQATGQPKP